MHDAVSEAAARPAGRTRILVADDGSMFRAAITRLLRRAGFEVEAAGDGAAALALATGPGGQRFDLLIADVVMPRIGGRELVRQLGEQLAQPPPTIFMSGQSTPRPGDRWGILDGRPLLSKPFSAGDLMAAIDGALAPAALPAPRGV